MRRSECYQRLGLRDGATEAQVKEAFRRRAKHVHPDVNAGPEAHEAFVRLLEAYRTLRDEPMELPIAVSPDMRPQAATAPVAVVVPRRRWGFSLCALFGLSVMLSASAVKPPEPLVFPSSPEPVPVAPSAEPSAEIGRSAAEPGEAGRGQAKQGVTAQKSATPRAFEASKPATVAAQASKMETVAPVAGPTVRRTESPPATPRRIAAPRRPGPKVVARSDGRRRMATLPHPPRAQTRRPRIEQWEEVEADGRKEDAPVPPQSIPQLPGLGLLRTLLGPQ